MNKKEISLLFLILFSFTLYSQVGIGTNQLSEKAILQIESKKGEEYKGFIPPKVPNDAAKASISPSESDEGLLVYVIETRSLELWNGKSWQTTHQNTSSGYATDLFISEYVEGSSNYKAIEIANFTGGPINLGDYQIMNNTNGGATGTGTNASTGRLGGMGGNVIPLSSRNINHGEVHVIVGTTTLSNMQDLSYLADQTSGSLTFNGDDPIVLMKNNGNTIVDVVGIPFLDWMFGEDITLRRKPGFGPSPIYVPGQFDKYPIDTFDGLGSHDFE